MMTKLYKHGLATPRSDLRSASLVIFISYGLYRAAQRMETPGGWNRPVVDLPHRAGACFVAGNSQRQNLFFSCFARIVHAVLNSKMFCFFFFSFDEKSIQTTILDELYFVCLPMCDADDDGRILEFNAAFKL